jgi:4-diphosphocytidyl-2-C-methyl-D-erythritol kinase
MPISVRCNAKINLFLKVYGKRPDGYHDIISVMQSIDLADRLLFQESGNEGIEIVCSHPGVPLDSTNLVWKAVELLSKEVGHPVGGMKIIIDKSIPVMGGLAGGSADAASTLEGLRKFWKLDIDDAVLYGLAGKLGSDVPFCLLGGTAIVRGRGEMLEPLPMGLADRMPDPGAFVLFIPPAQVETRGAYDLLDESREKDVRKWSSLWSEHPEIRQIWIDSIVDSSFPLYFTNDFETPVLGANPALAALHTYLRNCAGHVLLSGSGASMFSYFPSTSDALLFVESYAPIAGESAVVANPVGQGVIVEG